MDKARSVVILVGLVGMSADPLAGQSPPQTGADLARELRANVVWVHHGAARGFGFVVGRDTGRDRLYVVTAAHVAFPILPPGEAPPSTEVCFHEPQTCEPAERLTANRASDLDLGVLSVPYPPTLRRRPDAVGGALEAQDAVWYVGRDDEWYVPEAPGSVRTIADRVSVGGLDVRPGTSGAPLIAVDGIVGMLVRDDGANGSTEAIPIGAIRERVAEEWRLPWMLVPTSALAGESAACGSPDPRLVNILTDLPIHVRYSDARIETGTAIVARLRCHGAAVEGELVREGEIDTPRVLRYRRAQIQAARAVQGIVADLELIELDSDPEARRLVLTVG